MEPGEIESAYVEFTAILRTGEFVSTSEGWLPELISAHGAVNNDQIADTAERIVRDQRPHYDNERAVDDAELRAYEELQGRHLGYLKTMHDVGHLKVAGPLDEEPDERWRGICLHEVGSLDEARRLSCSDPAVKAGVLEVVVMRRFCVKCAVTSPFSASGKGPSHVSDHSSIENLSSTSR
jgi:uncharacterized protein YciI